MARVKRGYKARRRRNKILKLARGYHFDRRRQVSSRHSNSTKGLVFFLYRQTAFETDPAKTLDHQNQCGLQTCGNILFQIHRQGDEKKYLLKRKMLSEIAATDFEGFKAISQTVGKN